MRNRIHKIIDAVGLHIGGVLSNLLGVNGLRLLDGLLASLSHHVRCHLEPLCDALSTKLDPKGHFLLRDQLRAFHDTNSRLTRYDRCLEDGLAEFRDRIHLLMTIPGIDHASAHAILVELGPDIGVFASRRHCAAWAGLCPGNNQSAGKRRHGRTRQGNREQERSRCSRDFGADWRQLPLRARKPTARSIGFGFPRNEQAHVIV